MKAGIIQEDEIDNNINPFTHETDPPAIKTYNFGTDYAK